MAVDRRRSDPKMVGRWMEVGMLDGLAVAAWKRAGLVSSYLEFGAGGSLRYTLLVLGSASCTAGVRNRGRCEIVHNPTFPGPWLLGIGGGNESCASCWTAEVQGRSRGKRKDARRVRRALLPSYGVAVFAQGIRTMTLLRKMVRRPDNG
jgi:hypothetical protein